MAAVNGAMAQLVGYKEWVAVCEALGSGKQCLLLRKGGIHEGRDGFSFRHDRFYLFPTRFHAQAEQIRIPTDPETGAGEWKVGDEVPLRYRCEAVWARTVRDWERVRRLEPYHIWSEDLVRERFDCGEVQQIHCALVRVSVLPAPWVLPYEKKYGGCRTWVELPSSDEGSELPATPALADGDFENRRLEIEEIVGP